MKSSKSLYPFLVFSLTCLLMTHFGVLSPLVVANTQTKPSLAQTLTLPNRGAPGQRKTGAATRGECSKSEPLTALVPGTNFGLTSAEHPTFWFYVPYNANMTGEFSLTDAQGKEVYKQTISTSGTPGIISIRLPETVSPLNINQRYSWSFSLLCHEEILTVKGDIERISLTEEISRKLANASARDRVTIYAKNGLWFDLVTELAHLKQKNPQNTAINQDWLYLWQEVELEYIASKSLVACCDNQ